MRVILLILFSIIPFNQSVEILGLFLKYVHNVTDIHPSSIQFSPLYTYHTNANVWSRDSLAMFHAAIMLANQYNIRIHNENITSSVLEINNDENGHASLNLLCQHITIRRSNIVGIVGPASSTTARFIGPFAAHVKLPLVSYAATNVEFSDTQLYPTFYRTAPSDLLLARAIIQLFERFKWKTCTMIFQKNDYGYGGVKILSENYHNHIINTPKAQLPFYGDKFLADLKQTLEKSRSRIVLVWADEQQTTNIIKRAFEERLIGNRYIWMTTNKVALHGLPPDMLKNNEFKKKVEGLLTVIPFGGDSSYQEPLSFNETLLNDALAAFRNSQNEQGIGNPLFNKSNISSFGMFTFDATWTLIQALHKTSLDGKSFPSPWFASSSYCFNSSLENADKYHEHLKATQFLGISGPVAFSNNISNDRVGGAYYVLENLQYKNKEQLISVQVMKWYDETKTENGNWQNATRRKIVWPNGSENIPKDYPQIQGETLRIRVIESPPFVMIWNKSSTSEKPSYTKLLDTQDENIKIYGYVADLIDHLKEKMHFEAKIDAAPLNTTYNSIVESISQNKNWDIAISDISITSNRIAIVDFSVPIFEDAIRIVIREGPSINVSFFSYLHPFSLNVWLSVVGLILFSGLLVYIFERKEKEQEEEEQQKGFRAVITGVYRAINSIVGMGGDFKLRTTSSRMVSVALFAMGCILGAMYTANLASFLTFRRTNPPISGIDDIKNGRLPFHRVGVVKDTSIVDYYIQNVSDVYYPLENSQDVYLALLENRIDAALFEAAALEYIIHQKYCGRLSVVGVGFAKSSFGIAMKKDWEYKACFDVNILSLRERGLIEKKMVFKTIM